MNILDIKNKTFGKLTAISKRNTYGQSVWKCRCSCGKTCYIRRASLISGNTKSCGCLRKIGNNKEGRKKTHGKSRTPEYHAWLHMKNRCLNSMNKDYDHYGGRGITICKRWLKLKNFLEDMGTKPGREYTLERKDNNKGYYRKNCMWATRLQQQRNRRTSLKVDGTPLVEYCKLNNIKYATMLRRIHKNDNSSKN